MTDLTNLASRAEAAEGADTPLRRDLIRAICLSQQSDGGDPQPHECACMAEGGIGFGKVPGALTCRDTYENILDAIWPVVINGLRALAAQEKNP